jgi:glucosamine--fructose-6-phosphate aminotransferase (isomerizing)
MPQYDHGPKETAKKSIVINILAKGKSYDRTKQLAATVAAAGAHVFTIEEPGVSENASVVNNIIPFNYMAYYLSQKLNVVDMFVVGGKVTEVNLTSS